MTDPIVDVSTKPSFLRCAHPSPYPEVRVERPNPRYAALLLEDYAGAVSELTAITQYSYHHFVFEKNHPELAQLLSCVAVVEMHHLEILGETIIKLGADPRYRVVGPSGCDKYWDASSVFYGTDVCDRLSADVTGEWAAIANYKKHAAMIDDRFVKGILERIILDELFHITLFERAIAKYCTPQLPVPG